MTKGKYVDGFVIVIPAKNVEAYKKMAREGRAAWLKYGALDYKECIGDDITPGRGPSDFAKLTKLKEGETVWFSFITFKSRAHRDAVNKKVMAHFEKKYSKEKIDMPFDMKRLTYGGFKVEV